MARVVLASALARWLSSDTGSATGGEVALDADGSTLREVLDDVFAHHPGLRGYVLDEQGAVRHHVALFVDGQAVRGKALDHPMSARAELYVMQALSGG
ncbi:MoaD/ThiS family protein [Marilutibacter chinensis]|uniref:MoaD/ThiS family protein n=1 Tax=Marilutibacter chinensis TaxID=2912247 RepID=UPI001F3AF4D9